MKRPFLHFTWLTALLMLLILLNQAGVASNGNTLFYLPVLQRNEPPMGTSTGLPAYGVSFINSAEKLADAQQFANAQATGARWDRWPLYWNLIEHTAGQYDWSNQDAAAAADIAHNFRINAILLGTPGFYSTEPAPRLPQETLRPPGPLASQLTPENSTTPIGLYDPIFTDGSDIPAPGKQINPNNVWAQFVFTAVSRYKPGGTLAQTLNWPNGVGITHWEIWNEPDFPFFWTGTVPDYARLLKVGYLVVKQADPTAKVLLGGLVNDGGYLAFYEDVLTIYDNDPLASQHGYFHDILATHNYFYAWRSWYHVFRADNSQRTRGLNKEIWVNESGVAVWNDYPGPTWDGSSPYRGTMTEQADFIIQSAFYAAYAGADVIFHFQLYDGCGNQPAGTDFPPHNGELCGLPEYPHCAGDANGLFRNPSDAVCFRQHPQPETPRPSFAAYQVLTTYLREVRPYWRLRPGGSDPNNGPQEWVAFYQPHTGKRIVGMWARFGDAQVATIPATSGSALLVYPDGSTQSVTPVNGHYTIFLPGATNLNAPWDPTLYAIGGRPVILIEHDPGG